MHPQVYSMRWLLSKQGKETVEYDSLFDVVLIPCSGIQCVGLTVPYVGVLMTY